MRRFLSFFSVLLLLSACPLSAQDAGKLIYLGSIQQNRALLEQANPHQEKNLLVSPMVGYLLVYRNTASTTASIGYTGGKRQLSFSAERVAQVRVVIQKHQKFVITARRGGKVCFSQAFEIPKSGVWRLTLPC